MKYEDLVKKICGDNWRSTAQEEKDGGYAVAMGIAFINGVRPSPSDFSKHLGVSTDDIITAYQRMSRNGVFRDEFGMKSDPALLGNKDSDEAARAWSHIAGMGSGFVGV